MEPAPATDASGGGLQLLTGTQRAAALLMMLGEEDGKAIWSELSDPEVKRLCLAMTELGSVRGETVAEIAADFLGACGTPGAVTGNLDRAQELLAAVFDAERVQAIMTEVRGASAGRQVWRRLAEVPPDLLAAFLRNEYPQTVAVVLSRMSPEGGGRVLALLPDTLAVDVMERALSLGDVRPEAVESIEEMLFREFLQKAPPKPKRDAYSVMAERFDAFDRATETRFLTALEASDKDAAQRIREKMLVFEDMLKLDAAGIQTLMRGIDRDTLGRALKGAPEAIRDFFMANMSSRAAKNLTDDMEALGPIRLKDVEDAQSRIVQAAKALAAKGEIRIQKGRVEEDMIG